MPVSSSACRQPDVPAHAPFTAFPSGLTAGFSWYCPDPMSQSVKSGRGRLRWRDGPGGLSIISRFSARQFLAVAHRPSCFSSQTGNMLSQRLHAAGMTSVQQSPAAVTIARAQPRRSISASVFAIRSCSLVRSRSRTPCLLAEAACTFPAVRLCGSNQQLTCRDTAPDLANEWMRKSWKID